MYDGYIKVLRLGQPVTKFNHLLAHETIINRVAVLEGFFTPFLGFQEKPT